MEKNKVENPYVPEHKRLQLTIREATPDDAHKLSIIAAEIFRETFENKMPEDDLDKYLVESLGRTQLEQELHDNHNNFFLVFVDANLVGYAKLTTDLKLNVTNHDIEMARLYIRKSMHGEGLGSLLMQHCINFSANGGYRVMCLAVWERNQHAINFYTKWKFNISGEQIFMIGNDSQRGILMTKYLHQ